MSEQKGLSLPFVVRKSRREPILIIISVLGYLSRGPASMTHLVYGTNLNHTSANRYLQILKGRDLVVELSVPSGRIFQITSKGERVRRELEEAVDRVWPATASEEPKFLRKMLVIAIALLVILVAIAAAILFLGRDTSPPREDYEFVPDSSGIQFSAEETSLLYCTPRDPIQSRVLRSEAPRQIQVQESAVS